LEGKEHIDPSAKWLRRLGVVVRIGTAAMIGDDAVLFGLVLVYAGQNEALLDFRADSHKEDACLLFG